MTPKTLLFLVSAMVGLSLSVGAADAQLRTYNAPRPPVMLSPDVAEPWVTQLRPGNRHRRRYQPQPVIVGPVVNVPNRGPSERARGVRHRPNWGFRSRGTVDRDSRRNRRQTAAVSQQRKAAAKRTISKEFLPTEVGYQTDQAPGTIVIDTGQRYLYLVLGDGRAKRYGVGVGQQGFEWSGTETVTRKAEWPSWRPPEQMRERARKKGLTLPVYMPGGPENPLGARALYLGDTLYRIHGSNEPWTIGHAVSSGCIRMRNEDVIDLYNRVSVGAKVHVI